MEHRANGLEIFGKQPEIDQLFNGRYRLTFRCELDANQEKWYYDSKDEVWAEFGTLSDAGYGSSPATPDPDSTWPNQRLVRHNLGYIPQKDVPILTFVYETLTDAWVKEIEDVQSSTENGLRTLTRVQVAKIGTAAPYDEDDVGVSTITDAGKTLYLAGFEDQSQSDEEVQIGRFVTRWAEAGKLRERTTYAGDGKENNQVTFLVNEGSTTGIVVDRDIQSFQGLRTITVTTLTAANGGDITNGGDPVSAHDIEWRFDYPGEVSIATNTSTQTIDQVNWITGEVIETIATIDFDDHVFDTIPPVRGVPIDARRYVFYQTEDEIVAGDKTYDSAIGRWIQDTSATGRIEGLGCTWNPEFTTLTSLVPLSQSQAFSNYIAVAPLSVTSTGYSVDTEVDPPRATFRSVEGVFVQPKSDFTISVDGGPGNPEGNRYVLDIDITEDFSTPEGVKYYKKVIIVATIPTRPAS